MVTYAKRKQVPTKAVDAEKSLEKKLVRFTCHRSCSGSGQDDEWSK